LIDLIFGVLTPLSAISWRPVLVVEEAGVPGIEISVGSEARDLLFF
jgi:hypothetical protein